MNCIKKSVEEQIRIFRGLFAGLENVYGTYNQQTGRVRQIKENVTDVVIANHLAGRQSYGVYLLVRDRTKAIAVDFDEHDLGPPIKFVEYASELGLTSHIERSKSKGHHIWIFFEKPVPAIKARVVVRYILEQTGYSNTEVFPKRDFLDDSNPFGNFINTPLFGKLVSTGRCVFIDPEYGPFFDQWSFLARAKKVNEDQLDYLISEHNMMPKQQVLPVAKPQSVRQGTTRFSLPPCARRILAEGVISYQRIACFRLAVCLNRVGLPFDIAVAALKIWSVKNKPLKGKRIITEAEIISQAQCAYKKDYRGYGCEELAIAPYCSSLCPVFKKVK